MVGENPDHVCWEHIHNMLWSTGRNSLMSTPAPPQYKWNPMGTRYCLTLSKCWGLNLYKHYFLLIFVDLFLPGPKHAKWPSSLEPLYFIHHPHILANAALFHEDIVNTTFSTLNRYCKARPCTWPQPYDPDFDLSMLDLFNICHEALWVPKLSDSYPYSGVELRPWTFQWDLTLHLLIWTVLHINRSLHHWTALWHIWNRSNMEQSNSGS